MDKKALLDWKEASKDVYSKFKQDLEEQLLKPYHQTILDLGDGNAESLQSVIANFAAIPNLEEYLRLMLDSFFRTARTLDLEIEKCRLQECNSI